MTLAGYGANANTLTANAGATNAANVGNLLTSGAAANAASGVGIANALGGGASQYLRYTQGNSLIDTLQRNQNMQLVNSGGFSNTPAYMVNP
jgi:hypothetical protein